MKLSHKLGYGTDERLLIINADDFGMCHATNAGVRQLLTEELISSATVMMPCAWSKEATAWAAAHPKYNVGVHLTLTSEWQQYKWGPVTREGGISSLIDGEGYFPRSDLEVEQHADPAEVRKELTAQIELALRMGLDPTHLDNHMGSVYGLQTGRDFLDIVFDLCVQYGPPFRLPRHAAEKDLSPEPLSKAERLAAQADAKGIVILDYLLGPPFELDEGETYETFRGRMADLLRSLRPGVTELIIHPSYVTDELKAINPHWMKRGMEFEVFRDPFIQGVIVSEEIRMIRWSDLRDLQRRMS
ncbi:polysaccharide deacetylase family protein [Paenibacillus sp. P26]|nr:polysaccharide deacetylase family protein [Paenibacillus sp. P26]